MPNHTVKSEPASASSCSLFDSLYNSSVVAPNVDIGNLSSMPDPNKQPKQVPQRLLEQLNNNVVNMQKMLARGPNPPASIKTEPVSTALSMQKPNNQSLTNQTQVSNSKPQKQLSKRFLSQLSSESMAKLKNSEIGQRSVSSDNTGTIPAQNSAAGHAMQTLPYQATQNIFDRSRSMNLTNDCDSTNFQASFTNTETSKPMTHGNMQAITHGNMQGPFSVPNKQPPAYSELFRQNSFPPTYVSSSGPSDHLYRGNGMGSNDQSTFTKPPATPSQVPLANTSTLTVNRPGVSSFYSTTPNTQTPISVCTTKLQPTACTSSQLQSNNAVVPTISRSRDNSGSNQNEAASFIYPSSTASGNKGLSTPPFYETSPQESCASLQDSCVKGDSLQDSCVKGDSLQDLCVKGAESNEAVENPLDELDIIEATLKESGDDLEKLADAFLQVRQNSFNVVSFIHCTSFSKPWNIELFCGIFSSKTFSRLRWHTFSDD